jgi:hypothetical protein
LDIDQGEDWTCQIVWTDNFDNPQALVAPARMDIKGQDGSIVYTLETNPDIPEGEIPQIALSQTTGLIQLHIPKEATIALAPGNYIYDLFVTVDDGDTYAGDQTSRLIVGTVTVNKRVTVMT